MSDETTTCRHDVMTLACAMCRGEYVADLRSQLATLTAERDAARRERDLLKAALEGMISGVEFGLKRYAEQGDGLIATAIERAREVLSENK